MTVNGYKRGDGGIASIAASLVVLLLAALLALAAHPVGAVTCARPPKTLTSQCNELCSPYHPCVIVDNALDSEWTCGEPLSNLSTCVARIVDPCHYECFLVDKARDQNYSTFSFFVPFGAWRSRQDRELAASSADWAAQVAALSAVALNESVSWKSNDNMQKVEWLDLPATCTDVVFVGGTTEQSVKGKVASVAFAADAWSNNTFVTNVRLVNLDLESAAPTLAAMLPASQLTTLTLTNTLMPSIPANLRSLKQLLSLNLDLNYISSVSATDSLDSLLHLNLFGNNLTSFAAAMPKLQTLNLSSNSLTEIPSAIFEMTSLKSLSLDGNPLKTPEISVTQHAFLKQLATLKLSAFAAAPSCDASKQNQVGGVTLCVLDDSEIKTPTTPGSSTSSSSSSSSSSAGLIGGIAGGVVVIAIIVWVVVARRKRAQKEAAIFSKDADADRYAEEHTTPAASSDDDSKKRTLLTNNTSAGGSSGHGSSSKQFSSQQFGSGANTTFLSVWNDPELLSVQLKHDDIEDVKKIGSGAYGVVWLVRYRNSQMLASKRLKPGETDPERTQEFINEVKLVAKLEHPNIVHFVGAAWTVASDIQALFEYMDRGDLKTHLLDSVTPREWTQEKVQIAIDIAEALVYVHSFNPPLVHRDLKSRNVLLNAEMQAKLTDFGVSRFRSEDNTMTAGVGTAKWLAPEVIAGANDYNQSADIYALGVVLSEMDTHDTPFSDARTATGNPLPEIAVLQLVAKGELAPSFSENCPAAIRALAMRCLAFRSAERPSAVEIAYQLRTIQRSLHVVL